MREYKVVFGKNPMKPRVVYVNANNAGEAIKFVMDAYNVYRNMIHMTTWVNTKEVA
tara:strand:- start:520 stop:687 length:168 start_codon:yes stop_codon:yes gene_type:complete